MCLYPKLIRNAKYTANKKNGGNIPPLKDERTIYVPIGCGQCIECRKQKAREWQARLTEDIKEHKNGKFVTFTFSDESIAKLAGEIKDCTGYERDNQIATRAVRLFLERYRKRFKKSIRHWLVTELGHNGTENIHLHGIIWTDQRLELIEEIWSYGWMWKGKPDGTKKDKTGKPILINYVNEQTVNYIIKYMHKIDEQHKTYKPRVLTSPAIGRRYIQSRNAANNAYRPGRTDETYRTRQGARINLPIYWRNKLYDDEEKERLWLDRLDKQERWVMGERVDISKGDQGYKKLVEYYQRENRRLGYGGYQNDQEREEYERQRRAIMQATRIAKGIAKAKAKEKKARKAIWRPAAE